MKSLTSKNFVKVALIVVFSLCCGLLQAVTKNDIFEASHKVSALKKQISKTYEELRILNEEGGEHSQEQAQILMAEIREMKEELAVLEKSLESMKNGGPKLRSDVNKSQAPHTREDNQVVKDYSDRY